MSDRWSPNPGIQEWLDGFSDPEDRARAYREAGFPVLDSEGKVRLPTLRDTGPESAINAGVLGRDWTERHDWRYLSAGDAMKLHEAVSFANLDRGIVLNSWITFTWPLVGITCHKAAANTLSDYHREAAAWCRRRGFTYLYIYVHENGSEKGFHTHELAYVDPIYRDDFKRWVRGSFLPNRGKRVSPEAVDIQIRNDSSVATAVERQWRYYRYMIKSIDPEEVCLDTDGQRKSLVDLLKPIKSQPTRAFDCAKAFGGAHEIWTKARKDVRRDAPFERTFRRGLWSRLYKGWEIAARAEHVRNKEHVAFIRSLPV